MRELLHRVLYFLRRRQSEADLAEEMAFHREMKARDLVQEGSQSAEADRAAQRAFGSTALAGDQARDVWIWPWLQDIAQDFRFAVRLMARDPGFTVVAVVALGMGIGVSNTLFTMVYAHCIRGLPIEAPHRVVFLGARDARGRESGLSYRDFEQMQRTTRAFAGVAAFSTTPLAVGDEGRAPDRVLGAYISASAFRLLGETAVHGRNFRQEDDRPGGEAVAILGHAVWQSRYEGDPSVVGRKIRVDGIPTTVIGVMPRGFRFPTSVDLWQPIALMPGITTDRRDARIVSAFGRLATDRSMADVQAELSVASGQLAHDYPATHQGIALSGVPINERYNSKLTDPAWEAFTTAGAVVLLIACANVANMLLMRGMSRSHELALRVSLGATRGRLVRQLVVESALLATLGGLLGLVLASWGLRLAAGFIPEGTLPYWLTYTWDVRILGVLAAVCLGTVFLFGLAPALVISRTMTSETLKDGSRTGSSGVGSRRWMNVFLTAEFGLTMVLLAGVITSARSDFEARRADIVIDPAGLVTTWVTLPADRYPSMDERFAFFRQLDERLRATRLESTTVASALPFGGGSMQQIEIDGRPPDDRAPATALAVTIGAGYHATMRLPVLRGRAFSERDGLAGNERAIVNQRFAGTFFPDRDPIGQRIRLRPANAPQAAAPWLEIIGVSTTVRQRPLPDPDPVVYLPLPASPPATAVLIVRSPAASTAAIAPILRDTVRSIDRDLPLYRLMAMESAFSEAQWNGRLSTAIINGITAIGLMLAAVGAYTVSAHGVAQRTQEIGVRMALGSQPRQVAWLVLQRAAAQLAIGLAAGVACTLGWDRLFGTGAAGKISMTDPTTLVAVSMFLSAVAAVACLTPTWRATRLDPVISLRHE
jgi:predicted permease